MMGNGIAGAVILFNPAEDVFGNIESYAPFVKLLIVIDNSPSKNHALADKIKGSWNSVIIANGENLGLAAALNQAASIAREKGFEWLLTMDQDSRFEQGAMLSLEKAAFEHKDAGILSPVHVLVGDTECDGKAGWTPLRVTMTSGNLL
ncbi:MAG: glycosyltransferase, partial [Fibrobacteria bacterium]